MVALTEKLVQPDEPINPLFQAAVYTLLIDFLKASLAVQQESRVISSSTLETLSSRQGRTKPAELANFFSQVASTSFIKQLNEHAPSLNIQSIKQRLTIMVMLSHVKARLSDGGDTVENVLKQMQLSLANEQASQVASNPTTRQSQTLLYATLAEFIEDIQKNPELMAKLTSQVSSAQTAKAPAAVV
jgi:hypothetical protein